MFPKHEGSMSIVVMRDDAAPSGSMAGSPVIARELGLDRKTVRRTIARGLEPPVYGPRKPRSRLIEPFVPYCESASRPTPA